MRERLKSLVVRSMASGGRDESDWGRWVEGFADREMEEEEVLVGVESLMV